MEHDRIREDDRRGGACPDDLVLVGRILKAVGLEGEVKVVSLSDAPKRFDPGVSLWILAEPPRFATIMTVRDAGRGALVMRFSEWRSLDAVAGFRGCYLAVPESERPVLPPDSFYHDELKGLEVWTESGERLGVVRDVWSTGPHDVLVLDAGTSERLLPAIRRVVLKVDLGAHRMTVRPPDGWMDDAAL